MLEMSAIFQKNSAPTQISLKRSIDSNTFKITIHYLFLAGSGTVYCFGDGRNGQLGVRIRPESPFLATPSAVRIGAQAKILQIDCGAVHTAAVSGIFRV